MFQTKYGSVKIYTTNKWDIDFSHLEYDRVENFSKINNKSAERGYERAVEKLSTSSMIEIMYPSLSILANICQTLPVRAASEERSFWKIKMMLT